VHALLLRQRDNATYRDMLGALWRGAPPPVVATHGGLAPFQRGLYGASEMVMDGFMALRQAGVLVRRVFDDLALQTLLNTGVLRETTDADTLDHLIEAGLLPTALDRPAVDWLMRFGLLPDGTTLADGHLRLPERRSDRRRVARAQRARRRSRCASPGGACAAAAICTARLLGSRALYDWLGALSAGTTRA